MRFIRFKSGVTLTVTLLAASSLSACSAVSQEAETNRFSAFNADPSLFAPPTNDQYLLNGKSVGVKYVSTGRSSAGGSFFSDASDKYDSDEPDNAAGNLTITDGIMSSAVIIAQLDNFNEIKFELSEPVVFERKGEIADVIVCVGKLTTPSGVINDVKLILTPNSHGTKTYLDAQLDVPESFSFGFSKTATPLNFQLALNPVK